MYRLLIVDNERAIAESIKEMFLNLSDPELDVYTAYSAEEALSKIKNISIDVLVCDICMPDIDGIELAEILNKKSVYIKIIFLTAYDSFEYAKSAIACNVVDYVLKYEGEERIIGAVRKAIELLKRDVSVRGIVNRMKERIRSVVPIYIKEFLNVQIAGTGHSIEEIRQFFTEANLSFSLSSPVRMIVSTSTSAIPPSEFISVGQEIIKKCCAEEIKEIEGTKIYGYYVWVFEYIGENSAKLKAACQTFQRSMEEEYGAEISFVVGTEDVAWTSLANKFDEMCFILGKCVTGSEMILEDAVAEPENREFTAESFDYHEGRRVAEMIRFSLEEFNESQALHRISDLKRIFAVNVSMHYMPAIEIYLMVCQSVLNFINKFHLAESIPFYAGLGKMLDCGNFNDWESVWEYIGSVIVAMFECNKYNLNNRLEDYIVRVKHYVAENLASASLSEISDLLNINASYLSRIFKEHEGVGLHEYITARRLETARDMLLTTDMKIYDIAVKTGYETNAYFAKVFRRVYNMNPNEYRDTYAVSRK